MNESMLIFFTITTLTIVGGVGKIYLELYKLMHKRK